METIFDACYAVMAERGLTAEALAESVGQPLEAVERVVEHGDASGDDANTVLMELGIDPVRLVAHEQIQTEIVVLVQDIECVYTGMSAREPDLEAIGNTRAMAQDLVDAIRRIENVNKLAA
ncbi:MAG: hypothetical protein V3T86_07390 [Planctomycetota bacterium]